VCLVTLPAVLVGMILVILVTIIIKTSRSPVQAWKGSPLALLFMNVDPGLRAGSVGQMEKHEVLERGVGMHHAVLVRYSDGAWDYK